MNPKNRVEIADDQTQNGFAGFWNRLWAYGIDGTILLALEAVLIRLIPAAKFLTAPADLNAAAVLLDTGLVLGSFVFGHWVYYSLFESSAWRGTPGKRALSLQVTGLDGGRISFLQASGRYFGKWISYLTLGLGFLAIGFTRRRQGIHDLLSHTLVLADPAQPGMIARRRVVGAAAAVLLVGMLGVHLTLFSYMAYNFPSVMAKYYFDQGRYPETIGICNQIIDAGIAYPQIFNLRGRSLLAEKEYNAAALDFTVAIQNGYRDAAVLKHRAEAYSDADPPRTPEAIRDYSLYLTEVPYDAEAHCGRGINYYNAGDLTAAEQDLSESIRLDRKYAKAYQYRGILYDRLGRLDRSILDFSKVIRLEPNNAEGYALRGTAYERSGAKEAAIKDYRTALKLSPGHEIAIAGLARLGQPQ